MGWLRDLMQQAPTPTRSLGDLARSALRSGDWPSDTHMQPRSLAALFSKLDRGQELDWLADRPGAQIALARALGAPLEDVRARLKRGQESAPSQLIRLKALPAARALSLLEEPLFPGIPSEVLEPASFDGVYWLAPSGAGRSLSGRWLEARGLARFIRAANWPEAEAQLPASGAVFVELEAGRASAPGRRDSGLRLCIAAPEPPATPHAFRLIHSPAPETYLAQLVSWVAERSPQDGRFEPRQVLAWLQKEPLARGVLDGAGAALGLCGLADELGPRALTEGLDALVRRFAQARFTASIDAETSHAAYFRKHGYGALVALVRRLLAEDALPWDAPRSREAWLGLVPEELQREADLDWLKLTLGTGAGALRPADLERAVRKLPPGAFRVVRCFEQAGLLETAGSEQLKLGPRFVARSLLSEALAGLVSASPLEWGGALLEGSAPSALEAAVFERARASNGSSLEPLLETAAPDNLSYVAALELGFQAAGLALLEGADVPQELREGLFEDQLELMLELPGELPLPRVLRGNPDEAAERHGLWLLSALSLSEELPAHSRRHPLLRPWRAKDRDPRLSQLLDAVLQALSSTRLSETAALGVFALIGRLRANVGALSSVDQPHPLEQPSVLVEEVLHGVLTWPTVAKLGDSALGIRATQAAALRLGVAWSDLARAVWLAWDAAERPAEGGDFLLPEADPHGLFWAHIPSELLKPLLLDAREKPLPYAQLGPEPWRAIQAAVSDGTITPTSELVRHAPESVLDAWLLQRGVDPFDGPALAMLFERLPGRLLKMIELHFDAPEQAEVALVLALMNALPASLLEPLVELAAHRSLVRLPEATLSGVRKLLHRAVGSGGAGAKRAYPVLAELERQLSSTKQR